MRWRWKWKNTFLQLIIPTFAAKMFSPKQGNRLVEQYTKEFHELTICNQAKEYKAQVNTCFNDGFQMEIQLEMVVAHTNTIEDVYQLAIKSKVKRWSSLIKQEVNLQVQ